jgi:cytochrome c
MTEKTEPRRGVFVVLCGVALFAGFSPSPILAADAKHGEAVFKACAACHTERLGALGPSLKGVYGRKSGELEDFHYSNAMKRAGLVWDAANLKAYIADPQGKVKGNRMPFSGLPNPGDIDDVVAYLQTLK